MRKLRRFKNRATGKIVEVVQFGGSSTDIASMLRWMESGEFKSGHLTTCDIREFEFTDEVYGYSIACSGDAVYFDGVGYRVTSYEYFKDESVWENLS